jgi:hypothetical protein
MAGTWRAVIALACWLASARAAASNVIDYPSNGIQWRVRALRRGQTLTELRGVGPWQQESGNDSLDPVAVHHDVGASLWAPAASVTRIVVTSGSCSNITVARRVGDAVATTTATTVVATTAFSDHQSGITLIEPAGAGSALWLNCNGSTATLSAQTIDDMPPRLAWEQNREAILSWIRATSNAMDSTVPSVIGDDGTVAAALLFDAAVAHALQRPSAATDWRIQHAEELIAARRNRNDPYVDVLEQVPPGKHVIVDDHPVGELSAVPWQVTIRGPARFEISMRLGKPAQAWSTQQLTPRIEIDGANAVGSGSVDATPVATLTRSQAFPSVPDPMYGRWLHWNLAIPAGDHIVTMAATTSEADQVVFATSAVVRRQRRLRETVSNDGVAVVDASPMWTELAHHREPHWRLVAQLWNPTKGSPAATLQACQSALNARLTDDITSAIVGRCIEAGLGNPAFVQSALDATFARSATVQQRMVSTFSSTSSSLVAARRAWLAAPWIAELRQEYFEHYRNLTWMSLPAATSNVHSAVNDRQIWDVPRLINNNSTNDEPVDASLSAAGIAVRTDGVAQTFTAKALPGSPERLPLLRIAIARRADATQFPRLTIDDKSYVAATIDRDSVISIAVAAGPHSISVTDAVYATLRGPLLDQSTLVRRAYEATTVERTFTTRGSDSVLVDLRPVAGASQTSVTITCLTSQHGATTSQTFDITTVSTRTVTAAISVASTSRTLADAPSIALTLPANTVAVRSSVTSNGLIRLKAQTMRTVPPSQGNDETFDQDFARVPFTDIVRDVTKLSRQLVINPSDMEARLRRAELLGGFGMVSAAIADIRALPPLPTAAQPRADAIVATLNKHTTPYYIPPQSPMSPLRAQTIIAPAEVAAAQTIALTASDEAQLIAQWSGTTTTPSVGPLSLIGKQRNASYVPSLDELNTLASHSEFAVRNFALQWILALQPLQSRLDAALYAPLAYAVATTLRTATEATSNAAIVKAEILTRWEAIRTVASNAGFETFSVPAGVLPRDPRAQLRDALLAIPWDDDDRSIADSNQSVTVNMARGAATSIEMFCIVDSLHGPCDVELRQNQNTSKHRLTSGQRSVIALSAGEAEQQLEVQPTSDRSKVAVRLLDAGQQQVPTLPSLLTTFIAKPAMPVQFTTLAPTVLQITAMELQSSSEQRPIEIEIIANDAVISRVTLAVALATGITAPRNRTVSPKSLSQFELPVTGAGPQRITLRPSRGVVALRIKRRNASGDNVPDSDIATVTDASLHLAEQQTAVSSQSWATSPILLSRPLPPPPTFSISTLAGREALAALDSELAALGARYEIAVQARATSMYGAGMLSARARVVSGTGPSETLRGVFATRRLWGGLALSLDSMIGHGNDLQISGWMARATVQAKRSVEISRRLRFDPTVGLIAASIPTPRALASDPIIFSRYRREHSPQLHASAMLLWRPFADQRATARIEAWSNSNLRSLDTLMLRFSWHGLVEWKPLRGPVLSLRYQPSYRFDDDNRTMRIWRNDALASLVWPLGRWAGAWTLGIDADVYKTTSRPIANAIDVWLRWDSGRRGLLDFRPEEFELSDYLAATAWSGAAR